MRIARALCEFGVWLPATAAMAFLVCIMCSGSSWFTMVQGFSMEPTLHSFQIVFADAEEDIQRGDIVTARSPAEPNKIVIKRIVGLPGESVCITASGVYINGVCLEEGYLDDAGRSNTYWPGAINFVKLGDDQYYLLGDNRGVSYDSRLYGAVDEELIHCKQKTVPDWRFFLKLVIFICLMMLLYKAEDRIYHYLHPRLESLLLRRMGYEEGEPEAAGEGDV